MSLLDTIRNNSNKSLATQMQPQVTDETQKAATLLRAKSGKATGGGAVSQSNLGEQQAATAGASAIQNEVAPAAALQQAAVGQQESAQNQQTQLQQADIAQGRNFNTLQTKMKTNELLNDLSQGNRTLDLDKDNAALEQVGANLRLSTQKYTDDLQREGNSARLMQGNRFELALAQSILDDKGTLAASGRINSSILAADDRTFKEAMGNMDINTARALFNAQASGATSAAQWQTGAAVAGAGIGAATQYQDYKDRPATTDKPAPKEGK